MEKSNKMISLLHGAWDNLVQYTQDSFEKIDSSLATSKNDSTSQSDLKQKNRDYCEQKITTSDLIELNKSSAFKNQVTDFIRRNQKKDPSLTQGICEFTILDHDEFNEAKIVEYEKAGNHFKAGTIADYHSDNHTIRVQDPHNEEWVLNHETAHHWDFAFDKHQNKALQQTIHEYKDVSWVELCDENLGDGVFSQEESGQIFKQDFARDYATTNHSEDWATGVDTVLRDPIGQCEHLGQKETNLWTHKADIICENDQIVSSKPSRFSKGEDYFYLSKSRVQKILKRERMKDYRIMTRKLKNDTVTFRLDQEDQVADVIRTVLPSDFKPIHTKILGSIQNILISGYDQEGNFVVYQMKRDFSSKGEALYFVTEKDLMGSPRVWTSPSSSFLSVSSYGKGVVYALHSSDYKQTALFYYDLNTQRLHMLKNQREFLEEHFSEVKRIYEKDKKLYALGVNHEGKDITMSLHIELSH
ncbi:MAG: hypothetical protein H7A32_04050 [Deltaproteobacteria bacterium]|nr:hypothetical protein [Deltaproteobacteria bacterium]